MPANPRPIRPRSSSPRSSSGVRSTIPAIQARASSLQVLSRQARCACSAAHSPELERGPVVDRGPEAALLATALTASLALRPVYRFSDGAGSRGPRCRIADHEPTLERSGAPVEAIPGGPARRPGGDRRPLALAAFLEPLPRGPAGDDFPLVPRLPRAGGDLRPADRRRPRAAGPERKGPGRPRLLRHRHWTQR